MQMPVVLFQQGRDCRSIEGGDGFTMFKDAELLSRTMLVDNEAVMQYIEENLGGVIPESYLHPQGRMIITEEEQSLAAAA